MSAGPATGTATSSTSSPRSARRISPTTPVVLPDNARPLAPDGGLWPRRRGARLRPARCITRTASAQAPVPERRFTGLRSGDWSALVHVAAVPDSDDVNYEPVVKHLIHHSVDADPDAVGVVLADQLRAPGRPGSVSEQIDRSPYTLLFPTRKRCQGFDRSPCDLDLVLAQRRPRSALTSSQGRLGPSSSTAASNAATSSASSTS